MGTKHHYRLRPPRPVIFTLIAILGIAALIAALNTAVSSRQARADNPVASFLYDPNAVVNVSSLNLRTGPDVSYTAVAYLVQGQRIKLVGRNYTATWAQVELENGYRGWVSARYLQTNVAVAGLPVTDVALPGGAARVTVPILDVRANPDAASAVVATAYAGEVLWINGRTQDAGWLSVTLPNSQSGWVNITSISPNVYAHDLPIRSAGAGQPIAAQPVYVQPTATRPPGPPPIGMRPGQEPPVLQPAQEAQWPTAAPVYPLYTGPGPAFSVANTLPKGQVLTLLARTADNQWVLAQLPDGRSGWIRLADVHLSVPVTTLPLVAGDGSFVYPQPQPVAASPTADTGKGPQVTVVPTVTGISPTATALPALPTPTPSPSLSPTPPSGSVLPQFELRSGPGTEFPVVGTVIQGQSVVLLGRNADGTWLKIRMPDGLEGWVMAVTLQTEIPLDNLPILES